MAEAAFITWDGGGNVAVALGIATRVAARGHRVTVVGPNSLRTAILDQGLEYRELGVASPRDPALRMAYLREVAGSTNLTAGLDRLMAAWRPDAILIDCNLSWALQWADRSDIKRRTAVLVHTALGPFLPVWQTVLAARNEQRRLRHEPALSSARQAWSRTDRLLVASLRHFDREPPAGMPASHIGPVTAPHTRAQDFSPPYDDRPTVVVSYSTDRLQNGPRRVQTALNALADLPVRVLASTSCLFPAARLRVPAPATVFDYLPLSSALQGAALAVCHAGHGHGTSLLGVRTATVQIVAATNSKPCLSRARNQAWQPR